jgi:hypothetical protein
LIKDLLIFALMIGLSLNPIALEAPVVSPQVTTYAAYWEAMGPKGTSEKIESADRLLLQLVAQGQGDPLNHEIRRAALMARRGQLAFAPSQKDVFLNQSLRSFNTIYQKLKNTKDTRLQYDFYYQRGMALMGYPAFLPVVAIGMADLAEAAGLANDLGKPMDEQAKIFLVLAQKYGELKDPEKARVMAEKVMGVTDDPQVFLQAKRIIKDSLFF